MSDTEHVEEASGAKPEQRQRPRQTYGDVPWEPGKSRVEPETVQYLTEVAEHVKTIEDDEERELLLNNVLEELEGKELRVAADAVCSRLLESLLEGAAPRHLVSFMGAFTDEDAMYKLAGSAFGSHVAEGILQRLGAAADHGLGEEDAAALDELLDGLARAVGDQLHDYLMDRHATHVARALLRVAAGRDVVPASKQGKAKQQEQRGAAGGGQQGRWGGGGGGGPPQQAALAEKLQGSHAGADNVPPPRFPSLLSRLVRMLPCQDPPSMAVLAKNSYSGPFLQGILRAVAGNSDLLNHALPPMLGVSSAAAASAEPGAVLASVSESHMSKLLRDDVYSRLLEVVLAVAPPPLWTEFHSRFLKGRLMALGSHHAANYVVQAALAGATGRPQVTAIFEELQPFLGPLLLKRRSGILAALIAACGRVGVNQRDAAAAVATAFNTLPQWQGREGVAHLAPALMTLDTYATLGGSDHGNEQRLSTPGCALLATILSFPKNASRDFAASVAELSPADATRCACDASGSRALEALLMGSASTEHKKQLLGKLAGSWDRVALKAPGSFLVEKAYGWGDIDVKEAIVSRVAVQAQALSHCYWGPRLAKALNLEAYERNPDEWRKRAASAATTKRAYESLFGEDGGARGSGKQQKTKKPRKQKDKRDGDGEGKPQLPQQQPGTDKIVEMLSFGAGEKKKKQKNKV